MQAEVRLCRQAVFIVPSAVLCLPLCVECDAAVWEDIESQYRRLVEKGLA